MKNENRNVIGLSLNKQVLIITKHIIQLICMHIFCKGLERWTCDLLSNLQQTQHTTPAPEVMAEQKMDQPSPDRPKSAK